MDWTGAQILGPQNLSERVNSITSDTRTLAQGEVFIALRGEKFDGHHFLDEAIKKGAQAIISEIPPKNPSGLTVPFLLVKDTLQAYVAVGRALRKSFQGKVIAITGSAGKSSTKDMTGILLGPNTLISPKSFNNLLGVSKTLCLLKDETRNLVLEMGMNGLKEIQQMCEIFEPEGGAITNIGDAHIGKLNGREGIYCAKKELFDWLGRAQNPIGVALNLDDPWVVRAGQESAIQNLKKVTYSAKDPSADIFISKKEINPKSGHLTLELTAGSIKLKLTLPHFGIHHAYNLAAAVSLARLLEVPWEQIQERLPALVPSQSRGELTVLDRDITVIDESYNSNPSALLSSLESVMLLEPQKRKVLVVGEMRELDSFSKTLHSEVGEKLGEMLSQSRTKAILFAVGGETRYLIEGLKKTAPSIPCQFSETEEEASSKILPELKAQDVLFVKGSRGIGLDGLIRRLK